VEEVKVNEQLLADANKLMTDARIKGMKVVASLAGHTNWVDSVTFSPDGHIVSGSWDMLVKVWSVSARRLRRWLGTRLLLFRSPSVQMGNILSLEVLATW
jgi:WD40 repeat protein